MDCGYEGYYEVQGPPACAPLPACPQLAEAYVPDQKFVSSFPPMEALERGTMFPELYRPYVPRSKKRK